MEIKDFYGETLADTVARTQIAELLKEVEKIKSESCTSSDISMSVEGSLFILDAQSDNVHVENNTLIIKE